VWRADPGSRGERLRILFVTRHLPSRQSGSPVRIRGLIAGLAERHTISVLSFVSPREDHRRALDELRPYTDEVVVIPNERFGLSRTAKRSMQLRSLFGAKSFARLRHESQPFQKALDRLCERSSFDIIQVETCVMAHYAFPSEPALILDEHNIEYEILRRTVGVAHGIPRKLHSYVDYLKLKAEEEASWRVADACAVTTPRDEAAIRQAVPTARTAVVPNAADTEFYSPQASRPEPATILFFGTIAHYPNTDGLLFFLDNVMPLLKRVRPDVRLLVVGPAPTPEIRRRAARDVIVTGEVPDVRPYLERAKVVIVPLRIGGGTRLKIVEAMAMAKPVVSTSLGAEGLEVTDGENILLADDARTFADRVARILGDDAVAMSLGSAGRRLVERSYDWNASARQLEALYRSMLLSRERSGIRSASGLMSSVPRPR
jgi:glycosyltransferase involved in cell wall biosynthesis